MDEWICGFVDLWIVRAAFLKARGEKNVTFGSCSWVRLFSGRPYRTLELGSVRSRACINV